ncbi:MAG: hypothetical protein K0S30_957 [Clostridia bacterium]|jgi:hypothetical protein|nr:hypothetical protein [Clostridia bacterium]
MVDIESLYLALKTENKYKNLDEVNILMQTLKATKGSLESVISYIINQAVLAHMNLNIDSTIMQMLFLNDYLIGLFMKNFDILMNNYVVHYLQQHEVNLIEEQEVETVKRLVKSINMKTDLQEFDNFISKEWHLI